MPSDQSQSDDESTIAQEELAAAAAAAAAAANVSSSRSSRSNTAAAASKIVDPVTDEIEALKKESELDLEDVLNSLPSDYFAKRAKEIAGEEGSGSESEAEEEEQVIIEFNKCIY